MTEQWRELKVTITEMRDNDGTGTQQEVCKFLANLMETLEKQMQEPCEDCISRQAVLDYAKDTCVDLDKDEDTEIFCDEIKALPSATPKPKVGRWKRIKKPYGTYFECSECGKKLNWIDRDDFFCSNCGSDNSESTKEWFKEWDTSIAEMSGGGEDADSD